MSLAAPTRPLPSSPNSRPSDIPSRSSSINGPSRKGEKHRTNSTRSSPLRGAEGDSTSDYGRGDRERDKAARRVSGQLTGDPGPSNASISGSSARAGFSVNVNDVPQETVTWGSNFWVTIQDPMVSGSPIQPLISEFKQIAIFRHPRFSMHALQLDKRVGNHRLRPSSCL